MVKIERAGAQLADREIERLEQQLGVKLPDGYKRFLMANNGGRPRPDTIDVEGLPGSPTDIKIFLGLGRQIETSNIDWHLNLPANRLPKHLLPIASDSGGNLFCIRVHGAEYGSVIYADFREEVAIYDVARSFDEFLEKIRNLQP